MKVCRHHLKDDSLTSLLRDKLRIADGDALENFGKAEHSPYMVVFKKTDQCWDDSLSILSELFSCCEIIQGYIVLMNSNIYVYFRGFYLSGKVQTVLSLLVDPTTEVQVNTFGTSAD